MLRYIVPLLGLMLLAIFAVLYVVDTDAYSRALTTIGIIPFRYPFLDWEFIGAGIRCWNNNNIDVYITDPCDVLSRPFAYSPLWLRAVFIPTDTVWTIPIGIGMILAFYLSLWWLVKPVNWQELIIFSLTCASTMVVFALERGNVDVILFIMLVVAGVLSTGPWANRILSYALILLAGLLKFYPLGLLLTTLREKPRTFSVIAASASLIVAGFFYRFRTEMAELLKNIPRGDYAGDLFGSVNLPFGAPRYGLLLFPGLEQSAWFTALPYAIMAVLLIVTAVQVIRLARNRDLAAAFAKMPERDAMFLVTGAALITGCFFGGQSVGYRGIHLIFVVTGLVAMRRAAATRAPLTQALRIIVFLMWADLFRRALLRELAGPGVARALINEIPGSESARALLHEVAGPWLALYALFWLIREVLWWRLVALLLAMLAIFGVRSEIFAALQAVGGSRRGQSHLQRQKPG
jgi:hypothetical protein